MKKRTPDDLLMREITDMACAVRSQCEHCEHLLRVGGYIGQGWTCKAFPEKGIPIDLLALGGGTASRHTHWVVGQLGGFTYRPKMYRSSSGQKYNVNAQWEMELIR